MAAPKQHTNRMMTEALPGNFGLARELSTAVATPTTLSQPLRQAIVHQMGDRATALNLIAIIQAGSTGPALNAMARQALRQMMITPSAYNDMYANI